MKNPPPFVAKQIPLTKDHIEACEVTAEPAFDLFADELGVEVEPKLIEAAADLAEAIAFGDGLRAFDARDELARRWNAGRLHIDDETVQFTLYCAFRDRNEMSPRERQALTATVFGVPATGLPPGTKRNERFGPLFSALVDLLVEFSRQQTNAAVNNGDANKSTPIKVAISRAIELTRLNLQQVVTDAVVMQAKELNRRARIDRLILVHPKVLARLSQHDQLSEVIAELVPGAESAPSYSEQLFAAKDRSLIFDLIKAADLTKPSFTDAVDAAVSLRGTGAFAAAPVPEAVGAPKAPAIGNGNGNGNGSTSTQRATFSRTGV